MYCTHATNPKAAAHFAVRPSVLVTVKLNNKYVAMKLAPCGPL